MAVTNPFLVLLGLQDGTLEHMKAVANSVDPVQISKLTAVFNQGSSVMTESHGHLESSVDTVVTGWRGQAASAASNKVVQTALVSSDSSSSSELAQAQAQDYASQVTSYQAKINAIPPVDTSMHAAVQASGGPAAAILNPGAVATNMAAAQGKAMAHREQAAGHLNEMDDASHQMATSMGSTYTTIPAAEPPIDNMPSTLKVQPVSGDNQRGPTTNIPSGPSGTGGSGGGQLPDPGGKGPKGPKGPYVVDPIDPIDIIKEPPRPPIWTPPKPPIEYPPFPPGPGTNPTGVDPTDPQFPTSPPVALPQPVGGGGGGGLGGAVGLGAGLGVAGGAAAMAGGLNGVGRGAFAGEAGSGSARGAGLDAAEGRGAAGRGGLASEENALRANGRVGGVPGEVGADGSVLRGNGAGEMARNGAGGARGFGGAGEETPLRASGLGASAGELSAGERGTTPGMGSGGRRGEDDDELNKRPDYLVETDDLWGDGRLAAPPVLG